MSKRFNDLEQFVRSLPTATNIRTYRANNRDALKRESPEVRRASMAVVKT